MREKILQTNFSQDEIFHLTIMLENTMRIVSEELTFLKEIKGRVYRCEKCKREIELGINGILLFHWNENAVYMYCTECCQIALEELGKENILFVVAR